MKEFMTLHNLLDWKSEASSIQNYKRKYTYFGLGTAKPVCGVSHKAGLEAVSATETS